MAETLTLPSDATAEFFVLSSCFQSPETAKYIMEQIEESDFHTLELKTLYGLMKRSFQSNAELTSFGIMTLCKTEKLFTIVDRKLIVDISLGYSAGYEHYLDQLKMFSAKRKAVYILQDAIKKFCETNSEYEECVESVVNKLSAQYQKKEQSIVSSYDIHEDFNQGKDFETNLQEVVALRRSGKNVFKGVPTNYPKLDEMIGGFQNGSLTYVGARSHMGKTTFMLNLMAQVGPDIPMGVMTLEMPKKALYENFVSILAKEHHFQVASGALSDKQMWNTLEASRLAKKYQIYWEEYGDATIGMVCNRAKKLLIVKGIQILFIDYLTCINGGKSFASKHNEVTEISKRLQALSKDLNIPVVCLAQLNRDAAKRGDRPVLTDFRESGSIEQDADTCLLLHRPAYYDPNAKPGIMEVNVAKNRLMKQRRTIDYGQIDGKERMLELDYFNEAMQKIHAKEKRRNVFDVDSDE